MPIPRAPSFQATQVWYSGEAFYGNVANLVTDVNNDGAADLVAWNSNGVIGVKLANPGDLRSAPRSSGTTVSRSSETSRTLVRAI